MSDAPHSSAHDDRDDRSWWHAVWAVTAAPVFRWWERLSATSWWQAVWAVTAAFGAYFCMYGFRKPFTAAEYLDGDGGALAYKTVLVTSQVLGYTLSKFIGIRVVSEMPARRRAAAGFGLVVVAELALLAFAITPRPWNAAWLFVNGLPLGMVFGMVLAPLEGRRLTEALTAGLCASFILAGGVMKSTGAWLLGQGVSEAWMPAAAGAMFLLPSAVFLSMIHVVKPPSQRDLEARSARSPMNREQRRRFLRQYGGAFIPIVVVFVLVTIIRSISDDFAPEIWRALGQPAAPAVFTQTEFWVAVGVITASAATSFVRDNALGFVVSLLICLAGFGLMASGLVLQQRGLIDGFPFMVLTGLGLYLPYVIIHTTVFERLLALSREPGTIAFLMYVADAFGYLGYVVVMLGRTFGAAAIGVEPAGALSLFVGVAWTATLLSLVGLVVAWRLRPGRGGSEAVVAAQGAALSESSVAG